MCCTCMTEHMCHHIHYGVSMLSNPSITIGGICHKPSITMYDLCHKPSITIGDLHYKPSIIMEDFI
jgi:hypothetical protein